MKRSDALKELEKVFDIPRFPKDRRLTAELTLAVMEQLGMIPPPNINLLESMKNAPPSMFSYISLYFWEAEDETK